MDVDGTLRKARGLMQAKRVYAEPIERDGVTVIPAASISGGGGGGGTDDGNGRSDGGGGFGMTGSPVGAWVIRDGSAEWKPSLDLNRALMGAQLLTLLLLLALWLRRR
ncbi:MAG: spore germination protein GerW family protein [Solirubrobacterales bacterium]